MNKIQNKLPEGAPTTPPGSLAAEGKSTVIYLADEAGTSFGPYTESEFAALREEGKLANYRFIWDGKSPDWQPLARPPMPPVPHTISTPVDATEIIRAPRELKVRESEGILATCYDHHCMLSGALSDITANGCEILAAPGSDPIFATKSTILLDLLDTRTGESMTVPVRLSRKYRKDGAWALKLLWRSCPELLAA